MDILILSRIQFAVTIAFHYIYPPLSIGLGLLLVIMEGLYLKTNNPFYKDMTKFWAKIFGLTFAIGVATGIVMEFEFGTNWSTYSRYVGDVFGSALAAEGIFAFFLESGFLALLLFGWDRIGKKLHFFATLMVCLGAHFSSIWIVIAGSWMQTPAGYHIVGEGLKARAEITDFWAMVFNPSSMDRLFHVVMGCYQAGAFLVLSISAFYLLKKQHEAFAKASMKIALGLALFASLGQLVSGHSSALIAAQYQPAKMAAYEGHFPKSAPAGLYILGWVDEKGEKTHGIELPGFLSFLIHGDSTQPVTGLQAFEKKDRPPVNFVFQTYHAMITIGVLLIIISVTGVILLFRGQLFTNSFFLKVLVFSVLGPQFANQLGWFSAEVGRQPWIVYGLLRTSEGLSKVIKLEAVWTSLIMFTIIYFVLLFLFLYLLDRKIKAGPTAPPEPKGHLA